MNRRNFLRFAAGASVLPGAMLSTAGVAWAAAPAGTRYHNLLVLIELKGGNDGLNTVVPYASPTYYGASLSVRRTLF
jgi:uncharacterized protein (DUF1501 family)